jgi:hypothetical protein
VSVSLHHSIETRIICLGRTMEREEKAIGFDDYSIIEPYIILTMNRYVLSHDSYSNVGNCPSVSEDI